MISCLWRKGFDTSFILLFTGIFLLHVLTTPHLVIFPLVRLQSFIIHTDFPRHAHTSTRHQLEMINRNYLELPQPCREARLVMMTDKESCSGTTACTATTLVFFLFSHHGLVVSAVITYAVYLGHCQQWMVHQISFLYGSGCLCFSLKGAVLHTFQLSIKDWQHILELVQFINVDNGLEFQMSHI